MSDYIVGSVLVIAWAIVVLWCLAKIGLSAWHLRGKRERWDASSLAVGLVIGAVLTAGILLCLVDFLVRFDTFGLGFVLTLLSSVSLLQFAITTRAKG
jgi:hypothetical protein